MNIKRKTSISLCLIMLLMALFVTPVLADNAGLTPDDSQIVTKENLSNEEKKSTD